MAQLPEPHRLLRRHPRRRAAVAAVLAAVMCAYVTIVTGPAATATGEPQFTVSDITMDEPLRGENGSLPFTVTLEFPATSELTIPWRLYRGKPPSLQGIDAIGQLVFAPGETTKILSFPLAHDPFDSKTPYYYTLRLMPGWPNNDNDGVATVYDTSRDGTFGCSAYAYLIWLVSTSGVNGPDCKAGFEHQEIASADGTHLTVAEYTSQVVQYADNGVDTRPAAGDGGEAHVTLRGIVWRLAPGVVLRAASATVDARIVCTAVGALPVMSSSSSVTGLRINGAPPLGTIDDEHVIDLGAAGRIVLNEHSDHAGTIASGSDKGEPHRTITQSAIVAYLPTRVDFVGQTSIGQLFGNPCDS